jgi:AAA domain
LLVGELETEISVLKADLSKATELVATLANVNRKEWDKSPNLSADYLLNAKTGSDLIIANCDVTKRPTLEAQTALATLTQNVAIWEQQLESKTKAIEAATSGRDELLAQLNKLHADIEPLEYAKTILDKLEHVKEAQRLAKGVAFWDAALPTFPPLLKKITDTAKKAHEELVVADFEIRLNTEYKILAEKDMAAFGVTLARKGTDATVTVLPKIGREDINEVLSEGEQRIHALALFFAELESCPQCIVVFDDPVSSFDFNYIANYCGRLRDFAVKHPTRQVVILTHSWEFFVQLQITLKQGGLDARLAIQVMENCSVLEDYSEKTEDLKLAIIRVLQASGEPTKAQKEGIAGAMRRLIEAVVNTHVFCNERHQYKQKNLVISAFQSFTKVVPLLPSEATTLRDLYGKLSITEHDDPRNAYVNADKAMFQTRYSQILAVEAAIIQRK